MGVIPVPYRGVVVTNFQEERVQREAQEAAEAAEAAESAAAAAASPPALAGSAAAGGGSKKSKKKKRGGNKNKKPADSADATAAPGGRDAGAVGADDGPASGTGTGANGEAGAACSTKDKYTEKGGAPPAVGTYKTEREIRCAAVSLRVLSQTGGRAKNSPLFFFFFLVLSCLSLSLSLSLSFVVGVSFPFVVEALSRFLFPYLPRYLRVFFFSGRACTCLLCMMIMQARPGGRGGGGCRSRAVNGRSRHRGAGEDRSWVVCVDNFFVLFLFFSLSF